jgi:hypothetical protein
MNDKISTAITNLVGQVTKSCDATDALKYTQAILNLAHSLQVIKQTTSKD